MSAISVEEHLDKGWVHARMFFEVMAATAEVASGSLKEHVAKIKKMDNMKIVQERYEEPMKVENPPKNFKEGVAYSQFVEVEVLVSSLENLIYSVIFFGPSSVEIISPKEMKIGFESAQAMANSVAEMMHTYAAKGAGGIVISGKK